MLKFLLPLADPLNIDVPAPTDDRKLPRRSCPMRANFAKSEVPGPVASGSTIRPSIRSSSTHPSSSPSAFTHSTSISRSPRAMQWSVGTQRRPEVDDPPAVLVRRIQHRNPHPRRCRLRPRSGTTSR